MNKLISNFYTKSIRMAPNGFSLFYKQGEENLRIEHYPATQNALITNKAPEFFNIRNEGQTIDIVVATRMPLLIPEIIFDEDNCRKYLQMQFDISQLGSLFNDPLGRYRSLYFITQNEFDTIRELHCRPHFKSEASILYQFLLEQGPSDSVMLSLNDTFADILAVQNNEPLLVNRINHIENVDILYYTLNSMQQLGLNNPTLFVNYFGKENPKLNKLLAKYIDNIILL